MDTHPHQGVKPVRPRHNPAEIVDQLLRVKVRLKSKVPNQRSSGSVTQKTNRRDVGIAITGYTRAGSRPCQMSCHNNNEYESGRTGEASEQGMKPEKHTSTGT